MPPSLDAIMPKSVQLPQTHLPDPVPKLDIAGPVKQARVLTHNEAVDMAVRASGLQRSMSNGVKRAAKLSAAYLRNDRRQFRRPPKDTSTMVDKDLLIPHMTVMSRLIAILANIEDRPYDRQQREHWEAILETLKAVFSQPEQCNIEDRSGDVMKQILRYIVPKKLLEDNIDLEETDFIIEYGRCGPQTRAQDLQTLIDYISVVCQMAHLEGEKLTKAQLKLGRKKAMESCVEEE